MENMMEFFEISWYWSEKVQNDQKFVRLTPLKFLTFQLTNVRELETIKYAFAVAYADLVSEVRDERHISDG